MRGEGPCTGTEFCLVQTEQGTEEGNGINGQVATTAGL